MLDNSSGTVDSVIGRGAPLLHQRLNPEQIAAALEHAGLDGLPPVLSVRLPYSTAAERASMLAAEAAGPVSPDVVAALTHLIRSCPVEVRTVRRGTCTGRFALGVDPSGAVVTATSHTTPDGPADLLDLEVRCADPVTTLIARLPAASAPAWPSGTPSITAPRAEMAAALDRPTPHRFRAMGATPETADALATALGATTVHHDFSRGSAFPVVVIESGAGRLLATTRRCADGREWSTLGASSASRLHAELAVLVGRG